MVPAILRAMRSPMPPQTGRIFFDKHAPGAPSGERPAFVAIFFRLDPPRGDAAPRSTIRPSGNAGSAQTHPR